MIGRFARSEPKREMPQWEVNKQIERARANGSLERAAAAGISPEEYVRDRTGSARAIKNHQRTQGVENQRAFEKERSKIQNDYSDVREQINIDVSKDWQKRVNDGYVKTSSSSWSKSGDRDKPAHQTMMKMLDSGNKFTGIEYDLHFGANNAKKDRYARYGGYDAWKDNYAYGKQSFHGNDYADKSYVQSDEYRNRLTERNDKISSARERHLGTSRKQVQATRRAKPHLDSGNEPKHYNAGKYTGASDYVHDYHVNDPGYSASQAQANQQNQSTSASRAAQVSKSYQSAKNKANSWFANT